MAIGGGVVSKAGGGGVRKAGGGESFGNPQFVCSVERRERRERRERGEEGESSARGPVPAPARGATCPPPRCTIGMRLQPSRSCGMRCWCSGCSLMKRIIRVQCSTRGGKTLRDPNPLHRTS